MLINDGNLIMRCDIFKSSKKDEMYLYVLHKENQDESLESVPASVLNAFGRLTFVMSLDLDEKRKLARVNVLHVMDSLQTKGFFIQMPPEGLINPNAVEPEGLRGA